MSYSILTNNTEAQVAENTLESVKNQTNRLTSAQLSVGKDPQSIAIFSEDFVAADAVYVANKGSDTVSVVDPATDTEIKSIRVGKDPTAVNVSSSSDSIYVANEGSNDVSVISRFTNTVIKNIPVGDSPCSIGIHSDYLDYYDGADAIYVANYGSNTVSVINTTTNTVIQNITVGDSPCSIGIHLDYYDDADAIYVANSGYNTVSVIDPTTNTVIQDITVGEVPSAIAITSDQNSIYVANYGSNTVSVIDPTTNTVIQDITVGEGPISIGSSWSTVYVANFESNTVSVIDPTTNTVIQDITVGEAPTAIGSFWDSIYVANSGSNTLSVIDPSNDEVVAGVTFHIEPFRGGQIICNGLDTPINSHFYVASETECVAKPNNGYEFDSWVETLDGTSTRTINASTTSDWLVDPVAAFRDVFTDDPAATHTVNRFGNFTAYFRALPPPVPAEYTASLFTIVVTALVGSLLIPAAVSWIKSKKQISRLNSFHKQMALVYSDGKVDENDIDQLNILSKNISDSYAAGKISNDQYTNLKNEVSAAYQKIFKKRIESITDPNTQAVNNIRNDIEDAYSDRKITELDYNLLNAKISRMFDNK